MDYEKKYLKYKNKYYLKKNSLVIENDIIKNGSIDLINQKGGVNIQNLYKKNWWYNNSKLKTGQFRIGFEANNSIRQRDFEKLQFIEYVIDLCNNTPINDNEFICVWETGENGVIRRIQIVGQQLYTLQYGPSNLPILNLNDTPITIRIPEITPNILGKLVKFTATPLVQGHGGGSDFTCFGNITPDSNMYDLTIKLTIDWANPIFDTEIRNRSMYGMPGETNRIKNTRLLNNILMGLGYLENTPVIYVNNRSWYETHKYATSSKFNNLLVENEGSYKVMQNPI
jgi:hypothetical protein